MPHLTLAGLSDDGRRLLLVSDQGVEFTLDIDPRLRAALRGEHARLGQLEIHMDSALRPRDIQARIRAGEQPEAVAQAAQTTVDRIMPFAAPVLAERAHVAQRAQQSSVRRRAGDSGARTLGEAVAAQLRAHDVNPDTVEWDAWRREDGRWTLTGSFAAARRRGLATFAFDARGNFVTMEDDDARWLVGEGGGRGPTESAPGGDQGDPDRRPRGRRLSAVPTDELPLGEDALELVTDEQDADEPHAAETTLDLTEVGLGSERPVEAYLDEAPDGSARPTDRPTDDRPADDTVRAVEDAAAEEPAAREPTTTEELAADEDQPEPEPERATAAQAVAEEVPEAQSPQRRAPRKTRGRASVPSWDEIMFGGGRSE